MEGSVKVEVRNVAFNEESGRIGDSAVKKKCNISEVSGGIKGKCSISE